MADIGQFPTFPFEFDLGKDEDPLQFDTPDKMAAWATQEEALWAQAIPALTNNNGLRTILNGRMVLCGQYIAKAINARNAKDFWKETALYKSRQTLAAQGTLGQFIRHRMKDDPAGALGALLLSTTMHEEDQVTKNLSAAELEGLKKQGRMALDLFSGKVILKDSAEDNLKTLRNAQDELIAKINDGRDELVALREELAKVRGDLDGALTRAAEATAAFPARFGAEIDKAKIDLQDALTEIEAQIPKAKDDAAASIKALESAFRDRQHLLQPIDYWRQKKLEHRALLKPYARWWGFSAVVFVLGAGGGAWFLFDVLDGGEWRLWKVGVIVLYVSLGTWFLRNLAKLFFSAQHLAEEAHEREVMADGLFSLLGDANAIMALKTRNMRRIVDVLFRPAHKGVIKDDGPGLDLNRIVDALAARRSAD